MWKPALLTAVCIIPLGALAAEGEGYSSEAARFRNELRADQAVLSPGVAAHLESNINRLDRTADRDAAVRELRALERDMAFAQTGLPGSFSTLLGPTGDWPNVYAPSDAISSPAATR